MIENSSSFVCTGTVWDLVVFFIMGQEVNSQSAALKGSLDSKEAVPCQKEKFSYTRNFLLSFAELESCKIQPDGLDPQILRNPPPGLVVEGVNASSSFSTRGLIRRDKDEDRNVEVPEWRRTPANPGGLLPQGAKRTEHVGSSFNNNFTSRSGPSRVEASHPRSNYDRAGWQGLGPGGGPGRWEHRLISSDRERDRTRHDRVALEQDPGRPSHASNHLTWQGGTPPEHDGLLGSGSDLRSSRSSGGPILSNARGQDRHNASGRPNQASDTYQSLRSAKTGTLSRTEIRDIYNDETFGSEDFSNNERIEEERRRRDSFELMRKEQHKLLQEKQKQNLLKPGQQLGWELTVSKDQKKDENCLVEDGEKLEDQPAVIPLPDHSISSSSIKTSLSGASRPLVPPGFTKVLLEKKTSLKTGNRDLPEAYSEVDKNHGNTTKSDPCLEGKQHQLEESQPITSDASMNKQELQVTGQETLAAIDVVGDVKDLLSLHSADSSQSIGGLDTVSYSLKNDQIINLPDIEHNSWNIGLDIIDMKKAGESDFGRNASKEKSESILDKLFLKTTNDFDKADISIPEKDTEVINRIGDDKRALKSSKFARWFHTEEERPSGGTPVHNASDILSLFPKNEINTTLITAIEDKVQVDEPPNSPLRSIFPLKNTSKVLPMPDGPSLEDVEKVMTAVVKPIVPEAMDQFRVGRNHKSDSVVPQMNVLTCEYLEQTIIAQASESVSKVPNYPEENHTLLEGNPLTNEQSLNMDNHASQHLLSLLQKGTSIKDQKSPRMQYHEERHIIPSKEISHENSGYAEKNETPERTGAQTLEFLFGKQFMKELRSADAPVSVKQPDFLNTHSNDSVVEDGRVDSSYGLSSNRNFFPSNSHFESHFGKFDPFPSSGKINAEDDKITGLRSQEKSLADNGYGHVQDPWSSTENINDGNQSNVANSHFENAKATGNRNFAPFGVSRQKSLSNTAEKGEYSNNLNSDLRGEVLEASGFHDRNSIRRGLFDPGSKKPISDAGTIPTGHSFMGKNDSFDTKLTHDGRSMLLGRSRNGNSASSPILDEFLRANINGPQMSENLIFSDVPRSAPEIAQKPPIFTDEKSRYEDQNKRGHGAVGQHYHGGDAPVLESRISLNDMVGALHSPFNNSSNQSGGGVQDNFGNKSGNHQLFGLPSHPSHLAQQQLLGLADVPLSHSFPGAHSRPPPAFFPYHHGPGPYDPNLGAVQQINHHPPPQSRQMKLFDHGSSPEPQHPAPDVWSEHLPGRSFSQEQSGQMLYPLHNGPHMNQPIYNSLRPHGFPPNHFMQPVPVPQRGLSSMNNFPFIPDQMPHGPRGLPSNYTHHIAGPFTPEIPIHSMQGLPFHSHSSHTTLGMAHNQSFRPNLGASHEFSVTADGSQHAVAMGNDGPSLDSLFAKDSKRQPVGALPVGQYPGRNMGYG